MSPTSHDVLRIGDRARSALELNRPEEVPRAIIEAGGRRAVDEGSKC
jgi:hypothetical protein